MAIYTTGGTDTGMRYMIYSECNSKYGSSECYNFEDHPAEYSIQFVIDHLSEFEELFEI